jgi:hypothetical protein
MRKCYRFGEGYELALTEGSSADDVEVCEQKGRETGVAPQGERSREPDHHLVGAGVMLDEFGNADPTTFAAKLQKAG